MTHFFTRTCTRVPSGRVPFESSTVPLRTTPSNSCDGWFEDRVVEAAKQVKLNVPLVVRMEGTNVVEGKKILAESGMKVITANGMADAAERIVKEIGA